MMTLVQRNLPSGTVTFLFTDVEGSTKLLHERGAAEYANALAEHRRILRGAFGAQGGVEVDTQGDAFFVAFPTAAGALEAARAITEGLKGGPIRVRIGIHTGMPHLSEEGYVGEDVHKGARIAAAAHGGQVLLSKETRELAEVDVTDLGEHRLKDFERPVAIFQLGSARFPPLKTISNTNLPRPASSFVGREREVEEVLALLRDGARLLTLTGPGGSGKTRLAIEAAASLVPEIKAGVFWVGLAPLRDPALVTETIGQTIGAKDGLADHIGQRELLLVVDNLEQVVEAAPELATLVETCPNLKLMVTSRERLRVRGEVEYPVQPLAEPEAVDLFCARAGTEPDNAVRGLCRALDNLPLALELAAARASVLSPQQILERISERLDLLRGGRDADPRQQTLRATIEWSYELLPAEEKRLFARLAVFAGGSTLEAAERVADANLDTLQSLTDKSLLRHTDERFWMLETIRDYAADQLEASVAAGELRSRHAEHFLTLAEGNEPRLRDEELKGEREWLDRLELELDNFRAALDFLEASAETQLALRMAGALSALWANNGHVVEGRRRLEHALAADALPTAARAKALDGAAEMASFSEDTTAMRAWAEEALALHRGLGDRRGIADAMASLGVALGEGGDWTSARQVLEESLGRFRDLGNDPRVMWGTRTLAWAYAECGDLTRARDLYEDALRQARAAGNRLFESVVLGSLSWLGVREGRVLEASQLLKESLRIKRELGERIETATGLCHAASILAVRGRTDVATRLISCFEAISEEIGGSYLWVTRMNEGTLLIIRGQLDATAFDIAWQQGSKLTADEAIALALDALDEVS
jgi:predicted ATPase/class 3 adenylate cyclase